MPPKIGHDADVATCAMTSRRIMFSKKIMFLVTIHTFQIEFKRRKNHGLTSNEVEDGVINSEDKKT